MLENFIAVASTSDRLNQRWGDGEDKGDKGDGEDKEDEEANSPAPLRSRSINFKVKRY